MKILIGLLATACLIGITIFFATPSTQGQKERVDDATFVIRGNVSEKEIAFGTEYQRLYPHYKGRKFGEIIEEANGLGKTNEEIGVYFGEPGSVSLPGTIPESSVDFLRRANCGADAIVVGFSESKTSHMTEDESFIYTSYEFTVTDVLKSNANTALKINDVIEVTRPGGLIKLDNRRIRLEDRSYETIQLKRTYILFLKYVPSASGYIPVGPSFDFVLSENSFSKLGKRAIPIELNKKNEPAKLKDAIRGSLSTPCTQDLNGGEK